ncbi:hypothetical protein AXG93_4295s1360 [Marchantia polymorpha subsp. ruderalis]|uniref:SAC domain-containing protein n=1 Tax=Marchantia polymorpha subsp. ruderalis TaxID=1480154 RepID=A0A176WC22_MARPO|nr:hypothetical protein AXG93_4295s1360 [Marchantia polymorpha subsp. ruderalis]
MLTGGNRKETSVVVLELDSGDFIIVVNLSTRSDTQIIAVDPTTGALCYTGTPGLDVFTSEHDAWRYMKSRGMPSTSKPPVRARAIIGYAPLGSVGLLLVATRVKQSIPELPGGDTVFTVMESQWIKIPLNNSQFQSKSEAARAGELAGFNIDGLHYYCETRDITRHFPSSEPVENPDREFVWNCWLSAPFRSLGLQNHCVVLLQGFAEVRTFAESRDLPVTVAVTARRSRLHPGTRYLARGLNATFSTGNEVECEQLVWPSKVTPGRPHPFSSYLWRRGTVPIWWGAEIKSTVAEAEIYVAETDPYLGSGKYYRRLARRYRSTLGKCNGEKLDDQSPNPLIVCVNLLRNAVGKPETVLATHFKEAVKYVNSRNEVPDAKLCLMDYDWHAETKAIGEPNTVTGLWGRLKNPTIAIGFGMGEYYPSSSEKSGSGIIPNKGCQGGEYILSSKQDGVIRFNCADSLDRTNAASFFGAVQVLVEQCRRLGLPIDSGKYSSPSISANGRAGERDRESARGPRGTLPPGWEMRSDAVTGQVFYIDHNTKTTTWNHPCPDEPWRRFIMTVEEFRDATLPSPIAAMAELFLLAGDIHAMLYTGSKAMHSHIINIFSDEVGKGKRSAATNMAITLQRRFLNVLMDSSRQKQLEMFLGYRLYKYFPTLPGRPLQVLTRPQSCLLNDIPNMFATPNSQSFLQSSSSRDSAWVCPAGADSVQLLIYLAEPCHVCQILLTVAHGTDDTTSPGSFDVSTGRTLEDLKVVLEGSKVPKCAHGTLLTYPLPGAMDPEEVAITGSGAGEQAFSWLYDFEEQEGEIDFLTRLVEIKFYPATPGTPMTLGQVEVLGASVLWPPVLREFDLSLKTVPPNPKPPQFSEQSRSMTLPNIDLLSLESTTMTSSSFIDPSPMTRSYSTPNTAASQVFDLLTGEFIPEMPSPEQGSELSTFKNINGMNNKESSHKGRNPEGWNPFVTDSPVTATNVMKNVQKAPKPSRSSSQADPVAEVYLDLLKALCGKVPGKSITFEEGMELEIARLHLGLSAAGRDRALVSIGRDPATIDPNRLITTGSMAQVKQAASQLATISEIDTEDRDLSSLGFEETISEPDEIMENLHCLRIGCLSSMCGVAFSNGNGTFRYFERLAKSSDFLGTCAMCKRRVCAACHAGKGSALLHFNGPNPPGSVAGSGNSKPARGPTAVDAVVCKKCCVPFVRDVILLERVKSVLAARRRSRVNDACTTALQGLAGSLSTDGKGGSRESVLEICPEGEVSLADFPQAGVISSVPSANESEPVHSLLVSRNEASTSFWRAPSGIHIVELTVVLNSLSIVSSIMLMTKLGGYTVKDAPMVDLWGGTLADESARTYLGRFDVKAEISKPRSPRSLPPDFLRYKLRHEVTCRIIWIKFSLPSSSVSSNSNLGPGPSAVMDLLSFDTAPAQDSSVTGPLSKTSSDSSGSSVYIHAKRIMIIGQPIPEDLDTRFMTPNDRQSLRAFLDLPPKLSRLRVQVDMERTKSGGRVVEQLVNPQALNVAGFRLDAFAAVKNIAKYNPTWAEKSLVNRALGGAVDELITNLPTLRIRISAIQETNQPVFVGDYLLPIAKGGTPLYFDFGHPIMARGLVFELLGNISALLDEESNQTDADGKDYPLPSSLSLVNRIRIYRYALGSELGKWPQLNAV